MFSQTRIFTGVKILCMIALLTASCGKALSDNETAVPLTTETVQTTREATKQATATLQSTQPSQRQYLPTPTRVPTGAPLLDGKLVFYNSLAGFPNYLRDNADSGGREYDYYVYDFEKQAFLNIGKHRGDPALSPDGQYLAVSCNEDVMKLCIWDMGSLPGEYNSYPITEQYYPGLVEEIALPKQCHGLISADQGLISISWSWDGQRLAVVCGNYIDDTEKQVCIVAFGNGAIFCWDGVANDIGRVVWSPVEDLLLVSTLSGYRAEFSVVGPDGKDPAFLAEGWDPVWSPDGKRIAFEYFEDKYFEFDEEGNLSYVQEPLSTYIGIAVINIDGSGYKWVVRNADPKNPQTDIPQTDNGGGLAWSLDGNHIAFVNETGFGPSKIYEVNINTGQFTCVSCLTGTRYNREPAWAP